MGTVTTCYIILFKKIEIKNGYIRLSYSYGPPKLARSRTVGEPVSEPASEPAASSATARRARGHSCSQARRSCSPLRPLQISGGEPFPNDHRDFSTSPRTPRPRNVADDGAHLRTWRAGRLAQPLPHGVAVCALPAGGQLANPAVPSAWTALCMDSARPRGSAQVRHGSAPAKGLQRRRRTPGPEKRRGQPGTRQTSGNSRLPRRYAATRVPTHELQAPTQADRR